MFKVCEQFFTFRFFQRNCFNAKLEKNKNLSAQPKKTKRCFRQSLRSVFRQSLSSVFSKLKKQIGEKLVSKITTKLSKFQQRDLKNQIGNFGSLVFLQLENALGNNVFLLGDVADQRAALSPLN